MHCIPIQTNDSESWIYKLNKNTLAQQTKCPNDANNLITNKETPKFYTYGQIKHEGATSDQLYINNIFFIMCYKTTELKLYQRN